MNWEAIGAVGEILGASAVVLTLIYLARQMKQEAVAARSGAMDSWLADYNTMVMEIVRDPEISLLMRQGLTDFEQLDPNDQTRFHGWLVAHLLNAQNLFFQTTEGIMHTHVAEQILLFNAAMLKMKGGSYWWNTARSIWRPQFVEHMDKLIEQAAPSPTHGHGLDPKERDIPPSIAPTPNKRS